MLPGNELNGRPHVDAIAREVAKQLDPRRYEQWFSRKTRFSVQDDCVTVHVGSPYLLTWVQKQFEPLLGQVARTVLGPGARLAWNVDADLVMNAGNSQPESGDDAKAEPRPVQTSVARKLPAGGGNARPPGGRRYADLRQFVTGPSNDMAVLAARQVSEAPGDQINPLYIHGGVGVGKSHLLEGTYRLLRRNFPRCQVLLLTAENFANFFTQALREKTLPSFRQRFRNVDVLLVDDVDFLNGKKGIEEEFLNTLKKLEADGKQIVLTADRHPRLLTKLSEELVSRFLAGVVCRVEAPDAATRKAIVKQVALQRHTPITERAIEFVADRFTNSVRELIGAVNCLHTYHTMTGSRIGVADARNTLRRLERDCIRVVRLADVERAVCRLFGVASDDLKSARRARAVSQPRMLAMYLARRLTQSAYGEIGQFFGGRNHATVIAAERKVRKLVDEQGAIQIASEAWPVSDVLSTLEQQIKTG
ncbi:Chromosomal replication initiator protein DnaA [Maioricimonas rarisocia]|uniref:Chromosomal replication initiator protein DnaA n=1 Tax=Maioricimonas rarisocia TaxID=2528026 RepID=A0A517Z593_9PLAN|nr:chromosomal replication initiator protein DnaA [Maioricimonas rarisocia]QDU37623.1 Chromosomal replication initiator protein DnaA [Maioricimonas rarisocia]